MYSDKQRRLPEERHISDMTKQDIEFEFGGRHLLPTQDQQQYSGIASDSSQSWGKLGFTQHSITHYDVENNKFRVSFVFNLTITECTKCLLLSLLCFTAITTMNIKV